MVYNTSRFRSNREAWGENLQFVASFAPGTQTVEVRVAVSATSTHGALVNMRETDGKSFEQIRHEADSQWETELARYQVEGSRQQKETFYTSAYHAALCPFVYNDADGNYRTLDKNIERAEGWTPLTVFSLWDLQGVSSAHEPRPPGLTGKCGQLPACALRQERGADAALLGFRSERDMVHDWLSCGFGVGRHDREGREGL